MFNRFAALPLAAAVLSTSLFAADPNDFLVYNYDLYGDASVDLPGRLFVPTDYNPAQKYPLVLFFHGLGEGGTDNTAQVNGNINNLLSAAKARDFFLYAPQSGSGWWNALTIDRAMHKIAEASTTYSIDRSRLYVTGLSAGGGGTRTAITNYTDTFAAAVPVCGVADGNAATLPGKPIWMYHAVNDGTVNVSSSRNFVNAIRAADGGKPGLTFPLNNSPSNPYYNTGSPYYSDGSTFYSENNLRYSEFSSGNHGIWSRAYNEQPMYDWLLSKNNPLHVPSAPSPTTGDAVLFDFGAAAAMAAPDALGRTWNSSSYGTERTLSPAFSFPRMRDGERSSIVLSITDKFSGATSRGLTSGSIYPAEVAQDAWSTASNDTSTMLLEGLVPGGYYRISIFASDSDNDGGRGRLSRYLINGDYRDLNIVNNLDQRAIFQGVMADLNGQLQITVGAVPGSGSRYAAISALEITAVPEPSLLGLAMLLIPLCARRNAQTEDTDNEA